MQTGTALCALPLTIPSLQCGRSLKRKPIYLRQAKSQALNYELRNKVRKKEQDRSRGLE